MAKVVDLESYWMPILRKLYEFKQIAIAEEPELRYILEAIDRTIANMFIETADEYGISRFESMMGIYPDEDATLESRRFTVLLNWNSYIPYTYNELYRQMIAICGSADLFEIEEHFTEYLIKITTSLGVIGSFDEVLALLEKMLPCNLVLELENILYAQKTSTLYMGGVCCTAFAYRITNDVNVEDNLSGSLYNAVGVGTAQTTLITHDIEVSNGLETALNVGVGVSKGATVVITHDIDAEAALEMDLKLAIGQGIATTKLITNDIESTVENSGSTTVAMPVSTATVITINE